MNGLMTSIAEIHEVTRIAGGGGGWLPTDIGGCVLWLRASSLVVDGLGDGDAITTWRDESGQGNDVTEATASKRPILKLGIVNNEPVVRFDGSDDALYNLAFPTASARTVFVVAKADAGAGDSDKFWAFNHYTTALSYYTGTWRYQRNEANGIVDLGGNPTAGFEVCVVKYTNTSTAEGRINGGGATSFDPKDAYSTNTEFVVGAETAAGVQSILGDIAELVMFNVALSDEDRTDGETYLMKKYGI